MGSPIDLTGMPIDAAMSLAKRKLDRDFALELEDDRTRMIEDGIDLDTVGALVDWRISLNGAMIASTYCAPGCSDATDGFIEANEARGLLAAPARPGPARQLARNEARRIKLRLML